VLHFGALSKMDTKKSKSTRSY